MNLFMLHRWRAAHSGLWTLQCSRTASVLALDYHMQYTVWQEDSGGNNRTDRRHEKREHYYGEKVITG